MQPKKLLKNEAIAYPVSLIISQKQDKPLLEIRKSTADIDIIKIILTCAFQNTPLIVQPTFSDKFKAISSLLNKGIIYKGKDDQYYFNF